MEGKGAEFMTCINKYNLKDPEQAQDFVKVIKKLCKPDSSFELEDAIAEGTSVIVFYHRKGSGGLSTESR